MRLNSTMHKIWMVWNDGQEIILPKWPWRLYCVARGHSITDDSCGIPEHRLCWVCDKPMPNKPTNC